MSSEAVDDDAFHRLAALLAGRRLAVLTGAGVSTDSGIPDYRSPGRAPPTPIQHQQFVESAAWRQRYWARSVAGFERFRGSRPNAAHAALARMEHDGRLTGLITQNVDRLHHAAGSRAVVELHGALAEVRCLGCAALTSREDLQRRLLALNTSHPMRGALRPDGDLELAPEHVEGFRVAACEACGGVLMPNVVFFGGTVPRPVVEAAMAHVDAADALLVLGTSLAVYSGLRFVRRAKDRGIPVAIVTRGPTRGDGEATLKLEAPLGAVLPWLARGT